MKRKLTKYILACAVGVQFVLIFLCNYFKAANMLDYDASMAVRHAVEMWRARTIFLQNFQYTTSMEIDCASFFAAPIYILTGNYGLGIAIVHLVLDGILAYAIYRLLKNMEVPFEFRILGIILVFLPYQHGQLAWANMLFLSVGQYEFRVTSAVLLFLLLSYKERFSKRQWIELVVCECYIAVTVLSTGNYLIIVLLVPIVLYEIFNILKKEKIDWKDRNLRIVVVSILIALGAYGVRMFMQISTNRSNMNIIKETEFADNFASCITGAISLFGGLAIFEQPVISVEGIGYMVRFILGCLILGMGLVVFKNRKNLTENNEKIFIRFLFVLGLNMFVFIYTNTTYGSAVFEIRYHMMWCILLIMIDVMFLSLLWKRAGKWQKNVLLCCIVAGIVIIDASGFQHIAKDNELNEEVINRTLQGANKNSVKDIVVVDGVTSRQMGALDINKNVQFGVVHEENATLGFITWGATMDTHMDAKNIMAIKESDLQKLSDEIRSAYTELAAEGEWHILYTEGYEWN